MKMKFVQLLACLCLATLLAAGCSRESRMERHLQRAETYLKTGDFDRADLEYLNALRLEQTNLVALRGLGELAYEQGRFSYAYACLSAAHQIDPADFQVRLKLAQVFYAGGNLKEARAEAVRLLELQPTNEDALILLADSSLARNDVRDAQQRLAGLAKTSGNTAGYHLALGMLEARGGNLSGAETSFHKALSFNPKSVAAHMALGNLWLLKKDLANAQSEFKAAVALAPVRSPSRVRYADSIMMTGDMAKGEKILEETVKQAPDYLPALFRLAQVDLQERRFPSCENALKSLLRRDPTHLEAMLLMARLRLAQNQPDHALAELNEALKRYPKLPQVHYQIALVQAQRNDLPSAVRSLNQALALAPGAAGPTLLLAELNIRRGNPAAAIDALTKLAAQHPEMARAHFLLATAYRAAGDLNSALRIYESISRNYPTNPQPLFLVGLVQQQQGRNAEARKSLEKALTIDPDYMPAVEQLVNLDLSENQVAAAEDRARKEISRVPTNAAPYLLLAKVKFAETNLAAAEQVLRRAIAVAPDAEEPQSLLAQVYVAAHKHTAALKKFQELVDRNTNDIASWMQIAYLDTAASNYMAARKAYEMVLSVKPNYGPALNNLAYLCSEYLGDNKRAYELGSKARDLFSNDPHTADTFGWILYHNGDYPRALGLIQECVRRYPQEPEVLFHLGMTHYMMGEEAMARVALQTANQLAPPGASWKQEVRERLHVLAIDPATANAAAAKELEGLLARSPDDPIVLARLAALAERSGKWGKAAEDYEKALAINTNLVPVIDKLAQIYAGPLKDLPRASALARRARNLDPTDPEVAHTLGRIVFDSAHSAGDFKWACGLLQESARSSPEDADVLYDLARADYAVGQVSNATVAMQKVAAIKPESRHAEAAALFLEMNALLLKPGTAATDRVAAVLQQQPDYVPALLVSSEQQDQQGDLRAACDTLEKVLKLYPLFSPAYKSLALLYARDPNESGRAYDYASKAREAFPDDPQVARLLGGLAYERGSYPSAVQLLNECAPAYPADAGLFYMLGLAQNKTHQAQDCKESLAKALALDPNSSLAAEAKSVLAGSD